MTSILKHYNKRSTDVLTVAVIKLKIEESRKKLVDEQTQKPPGYDHPRTRWAVINKIRTDHDKYIFE